MSGPVRTEDVPVDAGRAADTGGPVVEVRPSRTSQVGALRVRRALPQRTRRTVGAWCFADHMGPVAVDEQNPADIGPHPHIGLQTVTWLVAGELLHHDSLGSPSSPARSWRPAPACRCCPRSPWLGGIDIDAFPGSLQQKFVAAAASFDADAVSPVHGDPQGGTVNDPGYVPFTTRELVRAAHRERMEVIPWTVDDPATIEALIDVGVDGIITDLPDRVRSIMAEHGFRLPALTARRAAAIADS